jgi:hypothetical protein
VEISKKWKEFVARDEAKEKEEEKAKEKEKQKKEAKPAPAPKRVPKKQDSFSDQLPDFFSGLKFFFYGCVYCASLTSL